MRSLVWKEIRESLPWASLLAVGWTLALMNAIHAAKQSYDYHFICYLLSPELVFITSWFPVLAGTILGLLAILPELSPDRWAYLVHRPIPMRQYFWAKVMGGLNLYALALGVPYGVLVAWIAFPGHQPGPFHLLMALPSLMDIVVGATFYLAAIVVGIRPGPWWGTKALPLLAAVFIWNFTQSQENWDLLFVTVFSGLALLLWTGRNCFLALEKPAHRSELPSPALCSVLCLALVTILQGLYNCAREAAPMHSSSVFYTVDNQERVLKVSHEGVESPKVVDLEGHPVASPHDPLPWKWSDYVPWSSSLTLPGFSFSETLKRGSMCAEYFYTSNPNNWSSGQLWYYDFLRKQCLGYDVETGQLVGMLTAGGFGIPDLDNHQPFVHDPEPDAQIGMIRGSRTLWTLHHEVIGLDFKKHHIHSIAKVESNRAYVSAYSDEAKGPLTKCIIAEGNHLAVYDWDDGLIFAKELSTELKGPYEFSVYRNPATQYYIVNRYPGYDGTLIWQARDSYYDILGVHGELLHHIKVPPLPKPNNQPWPSFLATPLAPSVWYPLALLYQWSMDQLHWSTSLKDSRPRCGEWDSFQDLYRQHPAQLLYDFGGLLLSSLAAYLLFRRLARRRGWAQDQTRGWRWAMILGGLPAWLAFRMLHQPLATMDCPLCLQPLELQGEACPHCHQPWPAAKPDGTEIL